MHRNIKQEVPALNNMDILEKCRAAVLELRALDDQLTRCLPSGRPDGIKVPQYDAHLPGTNNQTAASLQLYEGLMAQRESRALKLSHLSKAAWGCIKAAGQPRAMVILSNYYQLGMTDAEIAQAQGVTRETISRLRRRALNSLNTLSAIKD